MHFYTAACALLISTLYLPSSVQAAAESPSNELPSTLQQATDDDHQAADIIRRADRIRAPSQPFRYTLTLIEMKGDNEVSQQKLDVAMRFYKPVAEQPGDARALVRFIDPPSERGKSLLSIFDKLWYYEPKLRRPIPISRQQRLVGQVSNGDVVATDFDLSYISTLAATEDCSGRPCYRLELQRRWAYVTYPKITYWVDVETYRPVRAEFLSTNNKVLKRAWYQDYKLAVGEQRPHEIRIEDSLKKEQYTRMLYSAVRLEDVPETYFQKEYLLRLR
jgi:outer membrane lipoprotein-sorting protein